MKSIFLLIVASLVLCSCGKEETSGKVYVEPELEQYVLEFADEMGVYSSDVAVYFGDLTDKFVGECKYFNDGRKVITIDKEYWDKQDDIAKEQLIYHELGHCAMNLAHDTTIILDPRTNLYIEASIMNPYFFGSHYNWKEYRSLYKQALKHRSVISF